MKCFSIARKSLTIPAVIYGLAMGDEGWRTLTKLMVRAKGKVEERRIKGMDDKKGSKKNRIIVCIVILVCIGFVFGVWMHQKSPGVRARAMMEDMTLREKVAQMIMPALRTWSDTPEDEDSYEGVTVLNEELESFLVRNGFSGVCLFATNILDTEQMVKLTEAMQTAASSAENGIPMLVAADQEGGYVTRLTTGTSGIGNMALAATGDPENARAEAETIGTELRALGINTNFGPVVDVNNNPNNPVIGVRSFSDDPDTVTLYADKYILGLQSTGTMSCLKHFPGHGDTAVDSHTGLPLISRTYEELQACELIPFKAELKKADWVMAAHIQYPEIEKETYVSVTTGEEVTLPATLSRKIITGILREDLGFDGVVATDDLSMDAIKENFSVMDTAKLAINAGVDLLLEPVEVKDSQGIHDMEAYIDGIVSMVEKGEIEESEIDDSVFRILSMKYRCGLFEGERTPEEKRVSDALSVVGSREHHDAEWDMAMKAVTLGAGDASALTKISDDTAVLAFVPTNDMVMSVELAGNKLVELGVLRDGGNLVAESFEGLESDTSSSYEEKIKGADEIILVTKFGSYGDTDPSVEENIPARFLQGIIDLAKKNEKKVIVVSSQLPYDALRYPAADAVLLAYNPAAMKEVPMQYLGDTKKYGANLPAALVIALAGEVPQGKCPVQIPMQ